MAEGYTSSFDPVTGQRKETRFEYEPVQAQDTMPSQSISPAQMAEVYKYFFTQTKNPTQAVEAANDYIDAARQFKGRMLYQQAARENRLTPEFQARLAEDMFARNAKDLATVRKSFMPAKPQANQVRSLPGGGLAMVNPVTGATTVLREPAAPPQKPNQIRSGPGGSVVSINPLTGETKTLVNPGPQMDTIRETLPATEATPEIPASPAKQRGGEYFDWLIPDKKAQAYQPAMPAQGERTVTRKVPVSGATPAPALSEQAAKTAPPMPKSKAELKKGERYLTPRGEATWDGEKFVQ